MKPDGSEKETGKELRAKPDKKWRIRKMTKQQMRVIAQAEHEMFCLRDLLEGSVPTKVMNRAYEYVIKQDLLSVLRETPLTHQQLSVLTPQRRPLDFLYRLWLKTEYSHIDALRRAVRRETRRIYLKRQTEAFRKEHPMDEKSGGQEESAFVHTRQ